jgi:hypothetical protein
MSKTKRSPKPHHMATPLDPPCEKCGYDWQRPTVVLVFEAEELPMSVGCARCKAPITETPHV